MCKNNSRFSRFGSDRSPLQIESNLTRYLPAYGYYSYTNRYVALG
jgi:hypothetical protein